MKGSFSEYDYIFLILDNEDAPHNFEETLPPELCVSVNFCGSHNEASQSYQNLLNYIKENEMEIVGFSKEITMIDYGITNDTEKFVTEIRVPIKG